jgi:chemotaxis protein CheX
LVPRPGREVGLAILECPDAQPVSPEIRELLLEPFIAAANLTLGELAQVEPVVRSVYRTAQPRTLGDISAVLGLSSEPGEVLVLSFPAATAEALAARVLAEVTRAPEDALVGDCMGELANVIAGQAKTLLAETPYQLLLGTPSVFSGAGVEVGPPPDIGGLIVVFDSDEGDFALQVCLNWKTAQARIQ